MAYNNNNPQYNNNNNYQRAGGTKSETTAGFRLDNENASKFLNFNLWNKTVQLEIGTCPAGSPMVWEVIKNAQKISQVVSFGGLVDLCTICEEVLDSIKDTGNFEPVAIRAGAKKDCLVEISNGSNLDLPMGIYLVIYKGLDTGNRTDVAEFFPFDSSKFVRNYNHKSGEYREDNVKVGDFKKFYRGIKEGAKAFTMAQAHAVAEVKNGEKLSVMKALASIAAGLGVEIIDDSKDKRQYNNGGGYGNNGGGGYQKQSYGGPSNYGGGNRNNTFEGGNNYQRQQAMLDSIVNDPVDLTVDFGNLTQVSAAGFQ